MRRGIAHAAKEKLRSLRDQLEEHGYAPSVPCRCLACNADPLLPPTVQAAVIVVRLISFSSRLVAAGA